jgi:hypothetical protein
MKSPYGTLVKRISVSGIVTALLVCGVYAQTEKHTVKPHVHKKVVAHKATTARVGQVRAVLSPADFPISLTAYDHPAKDVDATGTLLEISTNGYKTLKPERLYTKDLDGEQISSVVSWQNPERTHFGFLVLSTPSGGNLYSVMFFLYHDGKLTMPIDEIATGYPVLPIVKKSANDQIQIEFNDGNTDATNDKIRTVVIYTWSDWSKRFLKNVHRVAGASVERSREGRRVEKTQEATKGEGTGGGDDGGN